MPGSVWQRLLAKAREQESNLEETSEHKGWSKQESDSSGTNRLANGWCDQTRSSCTTGPFSHFLVFPQRSKKMLNIEKYIMSLSSAYGVERQTEIS